MCTRRPLAACLVLCLLAPRAAEGGEGGGSPARIQSLIERLADEDVTVREAAIDALAEVGKPAVPALLAAVTSDELHTRGGASEALRRVGPGAVDAAPALLEMLRDPNEDLAAAAAYALGGIGRENASLTRTLLDAVHTWNDFEFAAQALAGLGHAAAPALVDALARGDRAYRLRLLQYVLADMGTEAMDTIPALILIRDGKDPELSQSAEEVLHGAHPDKEQTVTALIRSLENTNASIRLLCVQQLGGHGAVADRAAAGLAKRLAKDEMPVIREAAAEALSFVAPGAPETVPALAKALDDADEAVVAMAVCALGAVGAQNPDAALALESNLGRPAPIGPAVADALVHCGASAVPALVHGLAATDETIRLRSARAVGELGAAGADAVPLLVGAVRDASEAVREAAEQALGKLGPVAVPALVEALAAKEDEMRRFAAIALGKVGPDAADAVDALGEALRDRDPELRKASAEALGLIGAPAAPAARRLVKALHDRDAGLRARAATALGRLETGERSVVKALAKAARDDDVDVRIAAVDALGTIGPDAAKAVTDLLWCLQNAEIEVMWRAARALGSIHPRKKHVLKALVRALQSSDWRVQRYAAGALGALGAYAAEAREDLEHLAAAGREEVREAAKEALGRLDDE